MSTQTTTEQNIIPSKGEIIIYQTPDGQTKLDVKLDNDNVWLTQAQMSLLFNKSSTYSIAGKPLTFHDIVNGASSP